jgi:hypothetical protein
MLSNILLSRLSPYSNTIIGRRGPPTTTERISYTRQILQKNGEQKEPSKISGTIRCHNPEYQSPIRLNNEVSGGFLTRMHAT